MPKHTAQLRLNDAQRRLAEENIGLVYYTLRREFGEKYVRDKDNIAEGMYALCCAAANYDTGNGVTFATFAYRVIKNRMHTLARHNKYQKRKANQRPLSLDALISSPADMPTGQTVSSLAKADLISLDAQPEDIIDRIAYRALIGEIKGRYPMVVDALEADKKSAYIKALMEKERVTRQAISRKYNHQLKRVRQAYGRRYRQMMYGDEAPPDKTDAPGARKRKDESDSVDSNE